MSTLKNELKQAAADNLGRGLQQLSEKLDKQKTASINLLLWFQARFKRLHTNRLEGMLTLEESETTLNRLTHDVLDFIS